MSYNGYANYETWAVSMFLDGNYDGVGRCRESEAMDRDAFDEDEAEQDFYAYSNVLKDYVQEHLYDIATTGLAGDLLGAAMSEVDWMELAENRLGELMSS